VNLRRSERPPATSTRRGRAGHLQAPHTSSLCSRPSNRSACRATTSREVGPPWMLDTTLLRRRRGRLRDAIPSTSRRRAAGRAGTPSGDA
jgi:hypothetical protein